MEDILASIRRILADGEEEGASPPEPALHPAATHEAHIASEPVAPAPPDDVFVLDQSMMIEEPAPMQPEPESVEPVSAKPDPDPPIMPANAASMHDYSHLDAGEPPAEPLLGASAAAATSASLGALVRVVSQRRTAVYNGGPTLEDMVRAEIRPMVKTWLDEHLAPMVERLVRAEIDRVSTPNR